MTEHRLTGIEACVFDAYGTLFDFNSAVMRCRDEIGSDAERLSDIWRQNTHGCAASWEPTRISGR